MSDHLTTFSGATLSLSLSAPQPLSLSYVVGRGLRRRVVSPVASHVHLHKCEWRMALRWLAGLAGDWGLGRRPPLPSSLPPTPTPREAPL